MKFNWKILVALVVLVGVTFWGVDSLRTRSYSGTDLNFGVGSGPVTVTNPSDQAIPVQLVGTGTRSFAVSSSIDGVAGSSTREGSGRNTTQLFEFELPPGVSEINVVRGTAVNFVASADTSFAASVQPVNAEEAKSTLILAAIVIIGALFYISKATSHRWVNLIRREKAAVQAVQPAVVEATGNPNMGRDGRMYQDV